MGQGPFAVLAWVKMVQELLWRWSRREFNLDDQRTLLPWAFGRYSIDISQLQTKQKIKIDKEISAQSLDEGIISTQLGEFWCRLRLVNLGVAVNGGRSCSCVKGSRTRGCFRMLNDGHNLVITEIFGFSIFSIFFPYFSMFHLFCQSFSGCFSATPAQEASCKNRA